MPQHAATSELQLAPEGKEEVGSHGILPHCLVVMDEGAFSSLAESASEANLLELHGVSEEGPLLLGHIQP
eukprot:2042920-Lingulodinium_polyedra.AAC.1